MWKIGKVGPRMQIRIRRLIWDGIALAAVVAILWGVLELMDAQGPWRGMVMGLAALIAGYLAITVVYPFWFGE
jgi:hypothetical protein